MRIACTLSLSITSPSKCLKSSQWLWETICYRGQLGLEAQGMRLACDPQGDSLFMRSSEAGRQFRSWLRIFGFLSLPIDVLSGPRSGKQWLWPTELGGQREAVAVTLHSLYPRQDQYCQVSSKSNICSLPDNTAEVGP